MKKIDSIILTPIILYIVFFSLICAFKYNSFGYYDYDLSTSAYTVRNILHGSIHNTIYGVDFLGNHTQFIFFFIAPLYLLIPSPLLLLFLQTLTLGLAALPLYLLAKEELGKNFAIALAVSYLLYPALQYTNLFEFHPTAFATLFLMYTFYFLKKEKFWQTTTFAVLALLCQENMALIIFMIGIYALITKKSKRWPIFFMLGGVTWFILCVYFVIPYFNKGVLKLISFYGHMGNTLIDVAKYILLHPLEMLAIIIRPGRLIFLKEIFAPILFLPLLGIKEILIIAPIFLQHLLSIRPSEQSIYFHYTAEMIPFLFISMLYGIKRIIKVSIIKKYQHILVGLIVVTAIFFNIHLAPPLKILKNPKSLKKDYQDYQRSRLLSLIPKDASVIATFKFLPKMVNRKKLYSFHNIMTGRYPYSDRRYILPMDTEYALVDFFDRFALANFYIKNITDKNMRNFLFRRNWEIMDRAENMVLFRQSTANKVNLYECIDSFPKMEKCLNLKYGEALELVGFNINTKEERGFAYIDFELFWHGRQKSNKQYLLAVEFIGNNKERLYITFHPVCYNIYPVPAWRVGEKVKERFNVVLPAEIAAKIAYINMIPS